MTDTTELQARLNDRADEKLNEELKKIRTAIVYPLWSGWGSIKITMKTGNESVTVELSKLMDGLTKSLRKHLEERWREEETKKFMNKVEHLGDEIDALRDEAGLG